MAAIVRCWRWVAGGIAGAGVLLSIAIGLSLTLIYLIGISAPNLSVNPAPPAVVDQFGTAEE